MIFAGTQTTNEQRKYWVVGQFEQRRNILNVETCNPPVANQTGSRAR